MRPAPQYRNLLIRLADARIDAIVVGMASAVMQGVPIMTWDLDVVHCRSDENVRRLLWLLQDLGAVARGDPRRLMPSVGHLTGPGHVLLETECGDFDCLGTIDGNRGYEELLPHSREVDLDGRRIRVLDLAELLAIKRRAGRPKDLAAIPYIESTLEELSHR